MAQSLTVTADSPIGVFDSGLGGISVLRELYRLMPEENYLYFGDSANAPYGTKGTEKIADLTSANVEKLIERGSKAVVIACNTATAAAAGGLRAAHPSFPIIGLEPALKPAALSSEHPTVVVMATKLTLSEKKFADLLERFKDEAEVIKLPAPKIVELVEDGKEDENEMDGYLAEIFEPFSSKKIDCVVLGCTHFPFAKRAISRYFGGDVKIFDGAEGTARQTKRLLAERGLLRKSRQNGKIIFENSDPNKITREEELFYKEL